MAVSIGVSCLADAQRAVVINILLVVNLARSNQGQACDLALTARLGHAETAEKLASISDRHEVRGRASACCRTARCASSSSAQSAAFCDGA
jgi:hypothetical protein